VSNKVTARAAINTCYCTTTVIKF